MKLKSIIFLMAFLNISAVCLVHADKIYLKNGKVINGTIIENYKGTFIIKTDSKEEVIPKEFIKKIV